MKYKVGDKIIFKDRYQDSKKTDTFGVISKIENRKNYYTVTVPGKNQFEQEWFIDGIDNDETIEKYTKLHEALS